MRSTTRKVLTEDEALKMLQAAVAAWNGKNLRALSEFYTEDITWRTNWSGPANGPMAITGRQELIRHFAEIRDAIDCRIEVRSFRLDGEQVRASFQVRYRDPETGLSHVVTSRQILTLAGNRYRLIEEFQDAPGLQAFEALIAERKD